MSKNSGGEVTYEIVADDSQLESDLNEAGKRLKNQPRRQRRNRKMRKRKALR